MSVWLVARKHGISASQLFEWRNLEREGDLGAVQSGESVVPASEPAAARAQIAQLQRMLGKKTMVAEILREAVELAREKLPDTFGTSTRCIRIRRWGYKSPRMFRKSDAVRLWKLTLTKHQAVSGDGGARSTERAKSFR
jgi:transposase